MAKNIKAKKAKRPDTKSSAESARSVAQIRDIGEGLSGGAKVYPRWMAPALFFFSLLTYLLTTAHSVTFEDSGVFIGAAVSLGLPQPPGYPLYTLVAWMFTHLPFGTIAFRVHLFSSLCAAGAVIFCYLSALRIFKEAVTAALVAALLAISQTFWGQSIVAEVYPLHIFFFSVLFYLALRIAEAPSTRNLLIFGLIFGLSLANHWPLLILASPVFLLFAWSQKKIIFKRIYVWLPLALIVASLFYLWMMWRSRQDPAVSFLGPIESLSELWDYVSRRYYRMIEEKWQSRFIDRLLFFGDALVSVLWREWLFAGSALLLLGIYKIKRIFSAPQIWGLAFAFLSTTLFLQLTLKFEFNELNQNVMKVFHLVPIFACVLVAGAGVTYLRDRFGVKSLVVVVLLLVPAYVLNFKVNDLREDTFAESYARFVTEAIPILDRPQALIAATDADVGPFAYLRLGLGERPDLKLYTQSGVFFKDRIFDPFLKRSKQRYEKTESFIRNEGRIYSTKSMDIFETVKKVPFDIHYNGLFYEVSAGAPNHLDISPRFIEMAVSLLDQYAENPRMANWGYHREVIASRLCNFVVLRNVDHPVFKKSRSCKQVLARHKARMKEYAVADQLFRELIESGRMMVNAERHLLRYHHLVNQLEWVNAMPGTRDEKMAKVRAAVEYAVPGLYDYPHCGNSVETVIRSLRGQVEFSPAVEAGLDLFKNCKQ